MSRQPGGQALVVRRDARGKVLFRGVGRQFLEVWHIGREVDKGLLQPGCVQLTRTPEGLFGGTGMVRIGIARREPLPKQAVERWSGGTDELKPRDLPTLAPRLDRY